MSEELYTQNQPTPPTPKQKIRKSDVALLTIAAVLSAVALVALILTVVFTVNLTLAGNTQTGDAGEALGNGVAVFVFILLAIFFMVISATTATISLSLVIHPLRSDIRRTHITALVLLICDIVILVGNVADLVWLYLR